MIRSRVHRILRDPAVWIMLVVLAVFYFILLNRELRSDDLLYTYQDFVRVSSWKSGLNHINYVFGLNYATEEELFNEFVPAFLSDYPDKAATAICGNSSIMAVAIMFPTFFVARRFAHPDAVNALQRGKRKSGLFVCLMLELLVATVLLLDIPALLALLAKGVNLTEVNPSLLFRALVLRIPMIVAWMMPAVFTAFLFQHMFFAGLSAVAVFYAQALSARALGDCFWFPNWTWTQNDDHLWFWRDAINSADIAAYLTPCILIIVLWTAASYVVFLLRPIRLGTD